MADELNTPTHRWQQRRNNIALPKSDFSKKTIFASGIAKIDAWINSQPWGNPIPALFASGAQGVWYDPSDLTTMFTDRSGTTPVTAPGQTVGKRMDKSGRGNHATAPTDTARLIYGVEPKTGRRNLLTFTEQFDNAAWTKIGATVSVDTATAPNDATTADTITPGTTSGQYHFASWPSTLTGQSVISVYGKPSGYDKLAISIQFAGAATFDLTLGLVISGGSAASIQSVGNGWFRCSYSVNRSGGSNIEIGVARQSDGVWVGWTANGTSGIYIWGAQLETGSTATAYQRVTTAYDVTEAGVPTCHYVQYDGSDDSMSTAAIDFTATDKMSVFAGYRILGGTGSQVVLETSAVSSLNAGSFALAQGPAASNTGFGAILNAGNGAAAQTTALSVPYSSVATASLNPALSGVTNEISLRMNGAVMALPTTFGTDSGTGNFGNYPMFFGRRNNSNTVPAFYGRDYGIIVIGKTASAAEITSTEAYLAAKTSGVTLP